MNISADRAAALKEINRLNAIEDLTPVELLEGVIATPSGILWYEVRDDRGTIFFVTTSILKDLEKYGEKLTTALDFSEIMDHEEGEWV